MVTHLHDGSIVSESHGYAFLILESHAPHSLALSNQLANQVARLQVPDFDTAVTTTANNTSIIELQACHAVIVRSQPVNGDKFRERPDPDRAVRATCDKSVSAHLELAHE